MTPAEKLKRLKGAYVNDNRCQPIIDAFHSTPEAQNRFEWCSVFLGKADPEKDADLINTVFDAALHLTLTQN